MKKICWFCSFLLTALVFVACDFGNEGHGPDNNDGYGGSNNNTDNNNTDNNITENDPTDEQYLHCKSMAGAYVNLLLQENFDVYPDSKKEKLITVMIPQCIDHLAKLSICKDQFSEELNCWSQKDYVAWEPDLTAYYACDALLCDAYGCYAPNEDQYAYHACVDKLDISKCMDLSKASEDCFYNLDSDLWLQGLWQETITETILEWNKESAKNANLTDAQKTQIEEICVDEYQSTIENAQNITDEQRQTLSDLVYDACRKYYSEIPGCVAENLATEYCQISGPCDTAEEVYDACSVQNYFEIYIYFEFTEHPQYVFEYTYEEMLSENGI